MAWRSAVVTGPMRADGGRISVRCTMDGSPPPCSTETSASPTFSSWITRSTSSFGVGPECLGGGADAFLLERREGAQRVLDAVAELGRHVVGHVARVLRDVVDADALGADQARDALDLLQQCLRRLAEQQVRLVEEEHQLGFLGVADLGQLVEQLRRASTAGTSRRGAASSSACRRPGC